MKKVILFLACLLFVPCVFSQHLEKQVEKTLRGAVVSATTEKVNNLRVAIIKNTHEFRRFVANLDPNSNYFNPHFVFQSMINIMDPYMELYSLNREAIPTEEVNKSFSFKGGQAFTIVTYIEEQGCTLPLSEQAVFNEFKKALQEVNNTKFSSIMRMEEEPLFIEATPKAKELVQAVMSLMQFIHEDWKTIPVFDEMTMRTMYYDAERIMALHLQLKEQDFPLANVLRKYVAVPVKTGYGTATLSAILFNHAVEMFPGNSSSQSQAETYAKWLASIK